MRKRVKSARRVKSGVFPLILEGLLGNSSS